MTTNEANQPLDPFRVYIANLSVQVVDGKLSIEDALSSVQGMTSNMPKETQAIALELLRTQTRKV